MNNPFEPRAGSSQDEGVEKTIHPPTPLSAGKELRLIIRENKNLIWLTALLFLGMLEPAARSGPDRTDFILGAFLAVTVWAGIGWIVMAPFTAIRRQGIPTFTQVLLATTILGVISVFGGVLGMAFSLFAAS